MALAIRRPLLAGVHGVPDFLAKFDKFEVDDLAVSAETAPSPHVGVHVGLMLGTLRPPPPGVNTL